MPEKSPGASVYFNSWLVVLLAPSFDVRGVVEVEGLLLVTSFTGTVLVFNCVFIIVIITCP